jgi:hypothetical protein
MMGGVSLANIHMGFAKYVGNMNSHVKTKCTMRLYNACVWMGGLWGCVWVGGGGRGVHWRGGCVVGGMGGDMGALTPTHAFAHVFDKHRNIPANM